MTCTNPVSLGHKTETFHSTSMFQHHLFLEWNLKWPFILHYSIDSAFLQLFYMCESNPSTSGKRQACNPHRDVLSSSLSHFHWKSCTHNHLFQARFVYDGTHYTANTKLFLTTLASYNKTRAGSNDPTRAPSKYILPEQTCYFIMCRGRNLPLFSYHSNKTSLAEVSLQRTIF